MDMNIRIAKELAKLAKSLVAEERISIVRDEEGKVYSVGDSEFDSVFKKAGRTAAIFDSDGTGQPQSRAKIFVSPDVNVLNDVEDVSQKKGIIDKSKAFFSNGMKRLQNFFMSYMNRMKHRQIIYDAIQRHSDPRRSQEGTGYWDLGCTIEKSEGMYPKNGKRFIENSYVITIYGATEDEIKGIADELARVFQQDSVVIDYSFNTDSGLYFPPER